MDDEENYDWSPDFIFFLRIGMWVVAIASLAIVVFLVLAFWSIIGMLILIIAGIGLIAGILLSIEHIRFRKTTPKSSPRAYPTLN